MDLLRITEERPDLLRRLFQELDRSAKAASTGTTPLWRFPELPGWRFCNGRAAYFGPRCCEGTSGRPFVGPGSIAIGDGAGSTFDEGAVQAAWERWSLHERDVYTEARGMAYAVAEQALGTEGARDHGVRLLCARFGVNRVSAFRNWYAAAKKGGEPDFPDADGVKGSLVASACATGRQETTGPEKGKGTTSLTNR